MCGRYVIFTSEEYKEMRAILKELEKHFKTGIGVMKTGEIFPSYTVPAVRMNNDIADYTLMKWGFKFNNSKSIINARCETINIKPLFRKLERCILPANGFYEWSNKIKYFIKPEDLDTFYFAGLHDRDNNFVIITSEPSEQMSVIHNRMPVILNTDRAKAWLNENDDKILRPYSGNLIIKKAV